jgi:DNA-binding XRE family transcriptional regulator
MGIQYIDTDAGRLVVLPEADYKRLVTIAADTEAGAVIDAFRRTLAAGDEELVPSDIAKRLIDGENPVRVWRQHRGMTAAELAHAAGLSQAFVSQIETGKREGSISAMKSIAQALSLTLDDLV